VWLLASLILSLLFSGYYPALTHRLYLAPILYAAYLVAWRGVAAALRVAAAAARIVHAAAIVWGRATAVLACSGSARLLVAVVAMLRRSISGAWSLSALAHSWGSGRTSGRSQKHKAGGKARHGGGRGSLLSFPLRSQSSDDLFSCGQPASEGLLQPSVASTPLSSASSLESPLSRSDSMASAGSSSSSSRRGPPGLARRLLRVASVAARAAGVPLVHAWLSAKQPGGTDAFQGRPPKASLPRASGRVERGDRVQLQQPAPGRQSRSRALMQLMFGLQPSSAGDELRRQQQRQPPARVSGDDLRKQQQQRDREARRAYLSRCVDT
jgi:hypothetical protein